MVQPSPWSGAGCIPSSSSHNMYSGLAEVFGAYMSLQFILCYLSQYPVIYHPNFKISIYCDNQGVIDGLMNTPHILHPCDMVINNYSVYQVIQTSTTHIQPIWIKFIHVDGHLDTKKSKWPLTTVETLNISCNKHAMQHGCPNTFSPSKCQTRTQLPQPKHQHPGGLLPSPTCTTWHCHQSQIFPVPLGQVLVEHQPSPQWFTLAYHAAINVQAVETWTLYYQQIYPGIMAPSGNMLSGPKCIIPTTMPILLTTYWDSRTFLTISSPQLIATLVWPTQFFCPGKPQ